MVVNKLNLSAGSSLLEILISLCILSIGLLGFAQAQLQVIRTNQNAYLHSIAQIRLTSLAESIQACVMANCSHAAIANEVNVWNQLNATLLPAGKGRLLRQGKHQIINLQWQTTAQPQSTARAKLTIADDYG